MTARLSMLALALVAFGCGDDPAPKKGFLEECTTKMATGCMGAAGEDAANCMPEDNCKDEMVCRLAGSKSLCTKPCTGNAECAELAPSGYVGLCHAGNCTVSCTLEDECSRFKLSCVNSERCGTLF